MKPLLTKLFSAYILFYIVVVGLFYFSEIHNTKRVYSYKIEANTSSFTCGDMVTCDENGFRSVLTSDSLLTNIGIVTDVGVNGEIVVKSGCLK